MARACGWIAFLVPAALGTWQATLAPLWRSDAASLGLLGAPPAWQGMVSGMFGQLLQLLPIGATQSRAATLGGLALGVAGALVFRMALLLLERNAGGPRLNPILALCASLTSTLCLSWLIEGSVVGGEAISAALALGTLWLARCMDTASRAMSSGRTVGVAVLVSVTALESVWAALPVAAVLLVTLWRGGRLPTRRQAALFVVSSGVVLVAGVIPAIAAPHLATLSGLSAEKTASLQAGLGFEQLALGALEPSVSAHDWFGEVGLMTCVAALLGAGWSLLHRSLRGAVLPLFILLAIDLLVPPAERSELVTHGRVAMHLLAVAAVTCTAALGLQTATVFVRRGGLMGARPAVVLLTVLTVAVTWAGAEDSLRVLARRNVSGAETWTDEVLASLPHRSLVVLSSEASVRRLGAALASGTRPDVVVVPLSLLGRGTLAAELLQLEPALSLLIRELSITGRPSEQALTVLADVRPLFVEADSSWDRRLLVHLVPGPFFAQFVSHPLGRSDRLAALSGQRDAFERVTAAALGSGRKDEATLLMLSTAGRREVALLEALGDKEEARELSERLHAIGIGEELSSPQNSRLMAQVVIP